ncbi:unnamed protein product [Albugo candida]|uniref:Uncharacterized protein n=1 Tax=Albugo candida TaxID=65357 RepID=A0A024GGD6_9STRA|nr:unnamed protein product [Albugo candida]|eukprot:CCI45603.1 unnamed protein product [Albugo candida]
MSKTTKKAVSKQKKFLILLTLTSVNTQFVTPTQAVAQFDTRALVGNGGFSLKSLGFKNIRNRFSPGESSKKLAKNEEENDYEADPETENALASFKKRLDDNNNRGRKFTSDNDDGNIIQALQLSKKTPIKPMKTIKENDHENKRTYMPTRTNELKFPRSYGGRFSKR